MIDLEKEKDAAWESCKDKAKNLLYYDYNDFERAFNKGVEIGTRKERERVERYFISSESDRIRVVATRILKELFPEEE